MIRVRSRAILRPENKTRFEDWGGARRADWALRSRLTLNGSASISFDRCAVRDSIGKGSGALSRANQYKAQWPLQ